MSLVSFQWQHNADSNYRCYSIRNGIVEDILAQQLVPGDLILIGTGDRVPADVRLLEVSDNIILMCELIGITVSRFIS